MDLYMPTIEDTQINLVFPDGEKISVDATDIDALILSFLPIPEDSSYYIEFCQAFKKKYGTTISRTAAYMLVLAKQKMIDEVKKNSRLPLEWLDTTDQESSEPLTDDSDTSSNS